jgi:SAM-dependent methyltransferase
MESAEYEAMFRVEETHWWYRAQHQLIFQTLDQELPDWTTKRILDAGCGTGAILKRLGGPDRNVGIDLAPEAVYFCRKRGLSNVQQGDIAALPYAADSFDAVICSSVIYHQWVGEPGAALDEFHRVLRPNGLLLLNLPAFQFLYSAHDTAVMTARRFRKRGIASLLNDHGFSIQRLTYWTMLLFPLAVLARTLGLSKTGRDFSPEKQAPARFAPLLWAIMSVELRLLKTLSLPVGVALFAVATKRDSKNPATARHSVE